MLARTLGPSLPVGKCKGRDGMLEGLTSEPRHLTGHPGYGLLLEHQLQGHVLQFALLTSFGITRRTERAPSRKEACALKAHGTKRSIRAVGSSEGGKEALSLLWDRVWQGSVGLIQPITWVCVACEFRVVFTFLNGLEEKQRKNISWKWKLYKIQISVSTNKALLAQSHGHLLSWSALAAVARCQGPDRG